MAESGAQIVCVVASASIATAQLDAKASPEPATTAAVDLGSDSVHLIVAQVDSGRALVIEMIKDTARLAAGLDEHNCLTETAIGGALDVLTRFGQRQRHVPAANVRVVGTEYAAEGTQSP